MDLKFNWNNSVKLLTFIHHIEAFTLYSTTFNAVTKPLLCCLCVSFLAPLQRTLTPIAPYGETFLYNKYESVPVRQYTLPHVDSE